MSALFDFIKYLETRGPALRRLGTVLTGLSAVKYILRAAAGIAVLVLFAITIVKNRQGDWAVPVSQIMHSTNGLGEIMQLVDAASPGSGSRAPQVSVSGSLVQIKATIAAGAVGIQH